MFDLEGRVARERQGIGLRIEQMPKGALDRVLFQGLLDLADLNSREKMRERVTVAAAHALERAGNLVTFGGSDRFAVERQDNIDPFQGPSFIGRGFEELQADRKPGSHHPRRSYNGSRRRLRLRGRDSCPCRKQRSRCLGYRQSWAMISAKKVLLPFPVGPKIMA